MPVLYTNHFVQFFDNNGDPLSGGKLYAYEAGTTTPKATFTTEVGDTQNANPVILDSSGRATVFIDGSYRFDLFDSNDVLIKSTDNVTAYFPDTDTGQPGQSFTGKVFFPTSGELTILAGSITPTGVFHIVDTESDASTDNLDTINSGSDGQILKLRIADDAREVVIKHNTGNILTPDGSDITMTNNEELVSFYYDSALSKWLVTAMPSTTGKFESQLLHVQDQKASGTSGGNSAVTTHTRDLNTEVTNEITGASLTSNQITLPAGTYYIEASAPIYKEAVSTSNLHKAFLYNVTDTANTLIGTSEAAFSAVTTRSVISGRFTIAGEKDFEIRHISSQTQTNGLGRATSGGVVEVYTDVKIWKVG